MTSLEQQWALRRSALWIARRIDFKYATDRELLQIIEQQPVRLWHGSGRAIAARWEAQRRGLVAADPRGAQPVPPPEPSRLATGRVRRTEPDALLASLILDDPLDDPRGTQPVPAQEPGQLPAGGVRRTELDALLVSLILDDPL